MTPCQYTIETHPGKQRRGGGRPGWSAVVVDEDGNRGEGRGHDEETAVWRAFRNCQAARVLATAKAPVVVGYGDGC